MTSSPFELPPRKADCPSELELDRWTLSELDLARKTALDAHVPGCEDCQARLAERQMLMNAISPREKARMMNHIMMASAAKPAPATSWWRRLLGDGGFVPAFAAACAIALGVIWIQVRAPESPGEILRAKGGLGFTVYREHGGTVELAHSGETMLPGDRLRFGLDVPAAGHVMIVGVESSGTTYVCYPTDGARRSAAVSGGRTDALPGAIELDTSTGREELHLVYCKEPFSLDEITPVDAGRLAERGCAHTSFELSKPVP